MRALIFKILLVSIIVFNFNLTSIAQSSRSMDEIHAMMIYNFVKYIQWPDATQEFTIGVIGNDDVYKTLNTWYGGKIRGNKKFTIRKYNSVAEIGKCHILYLAKENSKDFDAVKSKVSPSTLMITNKAGLGQKGSGINFKVVNNKLAFELNQATIERSKLKVSSQLSSMAILI